MSNPKKKPGPKPETLKAEGVDWKDAVAHALGKKKPKKWEGEKGKPQKANGPDGG